MKLSVVVIIYYKWPSYSVLSHGVLLCEMGTVVYQNFDEDYEGLKR